MVFSPHLQGMFFELLEIVFTLSMSIGLLTSAQFSCFNDSFNQVCIVNLSSFCYNACIRVCLWRSCTFDRCDQISTCNSSVSKFVQTQSIGVGVILIGGSSTLYMLWSLSVSLS